MNVKRTSSLKPLAELADMCLRLGVTMEPSSDGFMLTKPGVSNCGLRKMLVNNAPHDGVRYMAKHAWGCGSEGDGGLHVMGV